VMARARTSQPNASRPGWAEAAGTAHDPAGPVNGSTRFTA
jgi:hypothetical protein